MSKLQILTVAKDRAILEQKSLLVAVESIDSVEFQAFIDEMMKLADKTVTAEGWRSAGLA